MIRATYLPFAARILLFFTAAFVTMAHAAIDITNIDALIEQSINTHPLINAAKADEKASELQVTVAKRNQLPIPTISTTLGDSSGTTGINLRQPLWTGGRLTANINQAIYADKAAQARIDEQQNSIAKNTLDIWQTYIYAIALQQLYHQNLKKLSEFEAMMQRRVKQGVSARIELDLITNRILQDQTAFQAATEQQRIAQARLYQLTGEPVTNRNIDLFRLSQAIKPKIVDIENDLFQQAPINNPSLVKQYYQIEAAKQQVKSQSANLYPTIYTEYSYNYNHKTHEDDGQLMLGLDYSPGAGFSRVVETKVYEAQVESLKQNQQATQRTLIETLQTQYQQIIGKRDQERSLIASIAGARMVSDSYGRQFIAGRKSWLEVLNAIREQAQYEQQLLQTQSQLLAGFYKLQIDLGQMSWQQNHHTINEVSLYDPSKRIKNWLKDKQDELVEPSDHL